jgi:hypothetical protein
MSMQIASRLLEQSEAEQMYEVETGAADSARAELGIGATRIGGGVALSIRPDPSGYWSKALGFGSAEPVTDELIDEAFSFYRTRNVAHATVQIAPFVAARELGRHLHQDDPRGRGCNLQIGLSR